jgi:hypothetical protein
VWSHVNAHRFSERVEARQLFTISHEKLNNSILHAWTRPSHLPRSVHSQNEHKRIKRDIRETRRFERCIVPLSREHIQRSVLDVRVTLFEVISEER